LGLSSKLVRRTATRIGINEPGVLGEDAGDHEIHLGGAVGDDPAIDTTVRIHVVHAIRQGVG